MAIAATDQSSAGLVTASVTTGSISQTIDASGSIAASGKTAATFATNGTVDKVEVTAGQTVTKGQVLATLDTASLQSSVDSANASVARAEQTLQDDETGQTSNTGSKANSGTGSSGLGTASVSDTQLSATSTPGSGTTTTPPGGSAGGSTGSLSALITQIQVEQKIVTSAQHAIDAGQGAVDAAQQTVDAAVVENSTLAAAQTSACAGSGSGSAACTTALANYEAYAATLTTDMGGLDTAIAAQDANVKTLDTSITTLNGLLGKLKAAAAASSGTGSGKGSTGTGSKGTGSTGTGSKGTGSTGSTGKGSTGTGSTGTGSTGTGSSSTGQVASASQLAADQANIDAANANLAVAQQNLSAATLKSPLGGTVASVSYSAGSSSSGGSITILGVGNQVVTVQVPLSEIDQVKTGQPATVAVDGSTSAPLNGTVTKIGLLSTTSGSRTTFPVTVTLADGSPALHNGVGADVVITTGTASNAVLVPNSAITTVGTRHTVSVVRNGKASTVLVTLGLTGSDTTQVTKGLSAGDRVEIADPSQPLPSSATTSSTTTGRLGQFAGTGTGGSFVFRVPTGG